jgi:hypothetical protein
MLLILKIIKIFKKCYHSVVVMWQYMSSVPVMRIVWRRELDSPDSPQNFSMQHYSKFQQSLFNNLGNTDREARSTK